MRRWNKLSADERATSVGGVHGVYIACTAFASVATVARFDLVRSAFYKAGACTSESGPETLSCLTQLELDGVF
jgi:hypothetical protein